MRHTELLDCTLRDGAYLLDKHFGKHIIRGITNGLIKAGLNYIEIGFLQDEGSGEGKVVYKNTSEAMPFIPKDRGKSEFVLLADYSRYSISNLDDRIPDGIDGVRECFFKKERFDAIKAFKVIKDKGYKLFVQPVDILGYSDSELIEFIEMVNDVEPFSFSIVDTFGSMYQEDLHRVFELIDHNLIKGCRIGFHSHNNMQLSNALSQEFARMTSGKRKVVIDSTLSGMGRGAGNTPTELIMQYLVSKQGAEYDIDALLDVIDSFVDNLRSRCEWGYSTEMFVAGAYGAHVNNINYLKTKNSIQSKDIRYILNRIGEERKRYNYELLEKTYVELLDSQTDDKDTRKELADAIDNREVLILLPGKTITTEQESIEKYIKDNSPVVISVNFIPRSLAYDFVYISNMRRFEQLKERSKFKKIKKIMTSNFPEECFDDNTYKVNFLSLIKCGWDAMDNSAIMLLRLLNDIGIEKISIAGFDGYSLNSDNYSTVDLEVSKESLGIGAKERNQEILEMLFDFKNTRKKPNVRITFITKSRFSQVFEEDKSR